MKCDDFSYLIDDYISGGLSLERRGECERHITACESCERLVAFQRSVHKSLHDVPQVKAPAGLTEMILAAVEAEEANANVIKFPDTAGIGCSVFDEHAAAYVDGLVDPGLAAAMDSHRASCPSCERLVLAHRAVASAFHDVESVNAPVGMSGQILAAARETVTVEVPHVIPLYRRYGYSTVAAGIFNAVAAMVFIISGAILMYAVPSGFLPLFESFAAEITSLPLQAGASIAARITPDQWVLISRLTEPVDIPYFPLSLPLYMFGALILFSAGMACTYRLTQDRLFSYADTWL